MNQACRRSPFLPFAPFFNGFEDGARHQPLDLSSDSGSAPDAETAENGEKRSKNGKHTL
jgi:hypothetical protein